MVVAEDYTGHGMDFDGFFAVEYPRLVRSLVALTGRRAVAEEIAQEALFEAYRRWREVQLLDRPGLWVRRVAVNRAISTHRRLAAEAAALFRIGSWPSADGSDPVPDPEVWEAVRSLPRRQAAALVLPVEGHTAAEIGEVLGCGAETARTHLRRARAALSVKLREEVSDDGG